VARPAEHSSAPSTASVPQEQASPALARRQSGSAAVRMPTGRRLNPVERAHLVLEILASYRHARRLMRQTAIEPAVQALRGEAQGTPRAATRREALYEARRLGRAVQLTLRLAPGDTRCLTRSLVLTQLLAKRGIPATLVIGARTAPSFSAHAWVEQAGQPVLPAGDDSFGRLVEL
jgi:hypothetical protein